MAAPSISVMIQSEHSKEMWERVASIVRENEEQRQILLDIFFSDDYRMVQRASQCLSKLNDLDATALQPAIPSMIKGLQQDKITAYKRNVMRILQVAEIP